MWTAVVTKSGQEFKARDNIAAQDFPVFLPQRLVRRRKRGGDVVRELRALFSGYVFAYIPCGKSWGPLANTRGVSRLLCDPDGRLYTINDVEMADLMDRYGPNGVMKEDDRPHRIPEDTRVKIIEGPYTGLYGKVVTHTAKDILWLEMEIGHLGIHKVRANAVQVISS